MLKNIFYASLIGKRCNNEDQYDIILNGDNKNKKLNCINFFAVYDGHNGNKVSKFLKENLSKYFLKKNIKYPLPDSYIYKIFDHLQKKLSIEHKDFAYTCGSTCLAIIFYLYNKKKYIHVINLGDCRAIICKNNLAVPLTKDHKPNWPDEKKRIEKLGGQITFDGVDFRIGSMSVSRSFGDIDEAPYISFKPDIFRYKITQEDNFICLACDGLWDVLENHDVVNFIMDKIKLEKNKKYTVDLKENQYNINNIDARVNIAKSLAEYAIEKGSLDNITVIIIFL